MSDIYCAICKRFCPSYQSLNLHLRAHQTTSKDYYDKYLKTETEGLCVECGSLTPWRGTSRGYQETCSVGCGSRRHKRLLKADSVKWEAYIKTQVGGYRKGSKNKNPYPTTEAVLRRYKDYPPPPFKGKSHNEETKVKMSVSQQNLIDNLSEDEFKRRFKGWRMSYKGMFRPKNPEKYNGNPMNIIWRSSWELKLYHWLDNSDDVELWSSEEIAIPYFDKTSNRTRRYFPDCWVRFKNGKTVLVEVKPFGQTIMPTKTGKKTEKRYLKESITYVKNTCKWHSAVLYCKSKGWTFMIMDEYKLGIKR